MWNILKTVPVFQTRFMFKCIWPHFFGWDILYSPHRLIQSLVIQPTRLIRLSPLDTLHWHSMLKAALNSTSRQIGPKIFTYFVVKLTNDDCTIWCVSYATAVDVQRAYMYSYNLSLIVDEFKFQNLRHK